MASVPVFRAIVKNNNLPNENDAGTLTSFWNKSKSKMESFEDDEPMDLAGSQADDEGAPVGEMIIDAITPTAAENDLTEAKNDNQEAQKYRDGIQGEPVDDGDKNTEKKRKRENKTPEQLAVLESHFASNAYPSTAVKKEYGLALDLTLDEINKWFEKRRKKARGNRELEPKRPRQSAVLGQLPSEEPSAAAGQEHIVLPPSSSTPLSAIQAVAPPAVKETDKTNTTKTDTTLPSWATDHEECTAMLALLKKEIDALRVDGLPPPLLSLDDNEGMIARPFSDSHLAVLIAGQQLPLSQLVDKVLPFFALPSKSHDQTGDVPAITPEALRSRIIDIATRKSYDPEDSANKSGGSALVDCLEALPPPSRASMWQWEVRDAKLLPKEHRFEAGLIKKRATRVLARLTAVQSAEKGLEEFSLKKKTVTSKILKAMQSLSKAKTLPEIDSELKAEQDAALAKRSKDLESVEDKQRAAKMKQEEKEQARFEKEAEKEKHRLDKEAEKERKHKEAEAAKISKRTGFKNVASLNKTANKFMSFFKAPAPSKISPSPNAVHATSPHDAPTQEHPSPAPQKSEYSRRFPRPNPESIHPQPTFTPISCEIDRALSTDIDMDAVRSEWLQSLKRAADRRRAAYRSQAGSCIGLPPVWARRSDAVDAARQRYRALQESGVDPTTVQTWRRKFLWCHSDSNRPPYHGSWGKPDGSSTVSARRPGGKDPSLDYDVMSDLDWEEEPEGDSLSQDDPMDDSEGGGRDDEEMDADSFMVSDGHLSAGEGWQLEDDMDADVATSGGGGGGLNLASLLAEAPHSDEAVSRGTEGDGAVAQQERARREQRSMHLKVQLERARRSGKPLLVLRPDIAAATESADENDAAAAHAGSQHLVGDPGLLEALRIEVLVPGLSFQIPEDPAAQVAQPHSAVGKVDAAFPSADADALMSNPAAANLTGRSSVGRPKHAQPEDLLPALRQCIQEHLTAKKDEVIQAFVDAHPDRKMSKKWVGEKITEMAEKKGKVWVFKTTTPGAIASGADVDHPPTATASTALAGGQPSQQRQPPVARSTPHSDAVAASNHAMPTPAVPSALKPGPLFSSFKAPERLVTAVDSAADELPVAASARQKSSDAIDAEVHTISSPYWYHLVRSIDNDDITEYAELIAAMAACQCNDGGVAPRSCHIMPAFVVSSLVSALQRNVERATAAAAVPDGQQRPDNAVRIILEVLDCLASSIQFFGAALGTRDAKTAALDDASTPSQGAWGEPVGPIPASLEELCREPYLLEGLNKCAELNSCGNLLLEGHVVQIALLLKEHQSALACLKEVNKENVREREKLVDTVIVQTGGGWVMEQFEKHFL